jgi:hypothetical protein
MSATAFQEAIGKLVTDEGYRSVVEADPNRLVSDFALERDEIGLLMQVWDKCAPSDVQGHIDVIIICCCCCP